MKKLVLLCAVLLAGATSSWASHNTVSFVTEFRAVAKTAYGNVRLNESDLVSPGNILVSHIDVGQNGSSPQFRLEEWGDENGDGIPDFYVSFILGDSSVVGLATGNFSTRINGDHFSGPLVGNPSLTLTGTSVLADVQDDGEADEVQSFKAKFVGVNDASNFESDHFRALYTGNIRSVGNPLILSNPE